MKRSKNKLVGLLFVAILSFALLSPFVVAAPQDDKIGVLLIGTGMPEEYDADAYVGLKYFFNNYLLKMMMPFMGILAEKVFSTVDEGTLLVDRDDPSCSVEKENPNLIDAWGRPYAGKDYKWVSEPSIISTFRVIPGFGGQIDDIMPQFSYYLAPDGPGKSESDIWEYMGLMMYNIYHGYDDHKDTTTERELKIMDEAEAKLKESYGDKIIVKRGFMMPYPGLPDARIVAEKLVREEGVKDLVLAESYVCYFGSSSPARWISEYLEEEGLDVNIVESGQIGGTEPYNKGVAKKVEEELKNIPNDKNVVVILNHHGMPYANMLFYDSRKEPYHHSAEVTFEGAKKAIYDLDIVENWKGKFDILKAYNEMAEGMMDPDNEILSVAEAADKAVGEGYEYCINVPYGVGNIAYETLIGLREYSWGVSPPAWEIYYEDGLKKFRTTTKYDGMNVIITDGWIDGYGEGYYEQISKAIDDIL
ncbi:MAG: hypothetical protein MOIL_01226 [Candidatus Methanolliviera sp. GoM_oil]|nr:MAG: hypothetical protein MOIL_01226 [Candidatus Methanolliviera sp. GoM_oil]